MKEGDIGLAYFKNSDGANKLRPILLLKQMPKFYDFLVCAISSNLNQYVENFDDIISFNDIDFKDSGIKVPSLIRLSNLAVFSKKEILGIIGAISIERKRKLIHSLCNYLKEDSIVYH